MIVINCLMDYMIQARNDTAEDTQIFALLNMMIHDELSFQAVRRFDSIRAGSGTFCKYPVQNKTFRPLSAKELSEFRSLLAEARRNPKFEIFLSTITDEDLANVPRGSRLILFASATKSFVEGVSLAAVPEVSKALFEAYTLIPLLITALSVFVSPIRVLAHVFMTYKFLQKVFMTYQL
ncbi:hypothetical protein B484DRAFT_458925 [Ochromonadaceae sp. CCMP2298]|nr:hypothetical protein B484DRAFT_458925 [Ochromonadaceae sp. CCMP2298]